MKQQIYLDYAAATPMSEEVAEAMRPYFSEQFYNPSATYLAGRNVRLALEGARARIAKCLGARPPEIIFTAGATEANNLAIQGLLKQHPNSEVLVSSIEHESVLEPAASFRHRFIPVDAKGIVDIKKLEQMVSDETVLVSVMLVNNELGTVQPVREISKILNKISILRKAKGNNRPLYLHTDAAQAANYLDLHVARLGVDLLSINGGKIYGPKQSGALYVRAGILLKPLIVGGGQEFNLRSGTENVAAFVGLAAALRLAQANKAEESKRLNMLRIGFEKEIIESLPGARLNGGAKNRSPHISSITFEDADNERLMMQLDEAGVIVAVGSACSASSETPSHVLSAIGLSEAEARAALRFSIGRDTDKNQLAKTARLLSKFLVA